MNVFRKDHRVLDDNEGEYLRTLKDKAQELYDIIEKPPSSSISVADPSKARSLALAKTNLEQAIMWAVKGVTG